MTSSQRLTRRLGSADLAGEAIHEVFLRIERGGELGEVRNPQAYLYRMAANITRPTGAPPKPCARIQENPTSCGH